MLELSKYIYNNYPGLKDKFQYWQILSLFDKNEDKIITVKENGEFKGSSLYLKISDDILWKIEYGFIDLTKPDEVAQMFNSKGDNVHFLYVLAGGVKTILRGLREVIEKEKPKTVSWYNPEMTKLNKFNLKREVVLCQ
jgi:hypothetical protein